MFIHKSKYRPFFDKVEVEKTLPDWQVKLLDNYSGFLKLCAYANMSIAKREVEVVDGVETLFVTVNLNNGAYQSRFNINNLALRPTYPDAYEKRRLLFDQLNNNFAARTKRGDTFSATSRALQLIKIYYDEGNTLKGINPDEAYTHIFRATGTSLTEYARKHLKNLDDGYSVESQQLKLLLAFFQTSTSFEGDRRIKSFVNGLEDISHDFEILFDIDKQFHSANYTSYTDAKVGTINRFRSDVVKCAETFPGYTTATFDKYDNVIPKVLTESSKFEDYLDVLETYTFDVIEDSTLMAALNTPMDTIN